MAGTDSADAPPLVRVLVQGRQVGISAHYDAAVELLEPALATSWFAHWWAAADRPVLALGLFQPDDREPGVTSRRVGDALRVDVRRDPRTLSGGPSDAQAAHDDLTRGLDHGRAVMRLGPYPALPPPPRTDIGSGHGTDVDADVLAVVVRLATRLRGRTPGDVAGRLLDDGALTSTGLEDGMAQMLLLLVDVADPPATTADRRLASRLSHLLAERARLRPR